MSTTHTSILDYLYELAEANDTPPVNSILQNLQTLLDANGIGVSCLDDPDMTCLSFVPSIPQPPIPLWDQCPGLVEHLRSSLAAHSRRDTAGDWLACLASDPRTGDARVVWLFHATPHVWSDATRSVWPLVAQSLVRCLALQSSPSRASLRRRLEQTAATTSRLSHDFGNYLTGILGFTELTLTQLPNDSLAYRYLQEVLQSARQGAAWLRRLHWFCRRDNQSTWPSELMSVIEEARGRLPKEPTLHWRLAIPADLPLVSIDAASLQTVLEELATNACEATTGETTLTITARPLELAQADCHSLLGTARPGRCVEITISDDGPSFRGPIGDKLFRDPFCSTKPGHRGLGLLVVYGILHRFHGGLRIGPADQPGGASVQLCLPALSIETRSSPNADTPHVLVVHPDRLISASIRKLLEWQGCRVTIAPTSQSALAIYQTPEQSFALVLAESTLPQLSGFDLARRILDRDARARFLFLHTSSSFHGSPEEEMLKRFVLVRWPVAPAEFLQAVETALRRTSKPLV